MKKAEPEGGFRPNQRRTSGADLAGNHDAWCDSVTLAIVGVGLSPATPANVRGMLVTRSRLAHNLDKLGLGAGEVTMVHCRMSALGHVVGGAKSVVRALLDALGPEGTLVAYTGWQDAPPDDLDALDEEARRAYLEGQPVYDPRVTLSCRDHGRLPEALRTWPSVRHSGHPEAGVAAVGPLAEAVTVRPPYDDAYSTGTP